MNSTPGDIFPQLIINWGTPINQDDTLQDKNIGILAENTYIIKHNVNLKNVINHALEYSKQIDILI